MNVFNPYMEPKDTEAFIVYHPWHDRLQYVALDQDKGKKSYDWVSEKKSFSEEEYYRKVPCKWVVENEKEKTGIELAEVYRYHYPHPLDAACHDYIDGSLTDLLCLGILVSWKAQEII